MFVWVLNLLITGFPQEEEVWVLNLLITGFPQEEEVWVMNLLITGFPPGRGSLGIESTDNRVSPRKRKFGY